MPRLLSSVCVLALFIAACSSPTPPPPAGPTPDRLIVFSTEIDPTHGRPTEKELFHGHVVLGKVEVTDPGKRAEIWTEARRAVSDAPHEVKCFDPRHGLRASFGGQVTDLHFCFECSGVYEYRGETLVKQVMLSADPSDLLNGILKGANVPVAPERGKK